MGKISEALEKSQKRDQKDEAQPSVRRGESPLIHGGGHQSENDDAVEDYTLNVDPLLVSALKPQSVESEQFRLLKNNILFPEKGTPPKCVMVTSASPGEGKSFVAANLAVSIAQNIDEYVLLMDCDLRSPNVHSLFGVEGAPYGLSEYLSKGSPLNSLLLKTFMNKLTILPAGSTPPNPSELLSSEQMRRLIGEVRQRYTDRYIIIDTPPPYMTAESGVISRQVDKIIIVVKKGKTQKGEIQDLIDLYGRDKILGVVYNFAQKSLSYGSAKYRYGKYGY